MSKSYHKSSSSGKDSKYDAYKSFSLKDKYETSNDKSLTPKQPSESSGKTEVAESKPSEPVKDDTPEDPNELGAKLIKAELMGDEDLVASLKQRLEKARKSADIKKAEQTKEQPAVSADQQRSKKHQHGHGHHKHKNRDEFESKVMSRSYQGANSDEEYDSQPKKQKRTYHASSDSTNLNTEPNSESCQYCFENTQKHLVISIGKHCYLSLPSTNSFVEGHCLIVPINHCSSSVTCDEEVWHEIQEFRRVLVKMFDKKKFDCVFFEQYSQTNKYAHLVIECVPLGTHVSNMAPIYFKKALVESESEWAQNKSLIDLSKQNLRKTIPRNLPYFTVSFGLDDGYAHIIENSNSFPDYFAKEVMGGILDLDPLEWRRPRKDTFSDQSHKVIEFLKWWKPYEFNRK